MEKALITGGAGFIGSWVTDDLIKKGLEVVVLDNLLTGRKENLNKNAEFYKIDINDKKICEIFEEEKPDYVFHLAAQINVRESIKNPLKDAEANILGSLNLLNACVKNKIKKFIFSSSGGAIYSPDSKIPTAEKEVENPLTPYGISKLTVEKYLGFYGNIHGLDYASLRYSNVYGPRQNSKGEAGVVAVFIDKILNKECPVINGSGKQTRDYVYVKDVSKANILSLNKNISGVYNLSTGYETSVNELFSKISKSLNSKIKKIHGPEIKGEQMRSCLDSGKIIKKRWMPEYSFDDGLAETINWFKKKNNL